MIVALFHDEGSLVRATRRLREAGIEPLETYTPAPLKDAPKTSPVPVIMLAAGLIGSLSSLALQTWSYTAAYPFPIGGRPQFAWPSFTPTLFENGILVAVTAGFISFLTYNGFPRLYDPIDEAEIMRRASQDGWIVAVRSKDASTLADARTLLAELGAARIEAVQP